jgi:hypothetical protein
MSNELRLPEYANSAAGKLVLDAFVEEFSQTWDIIRAYNRAVEVSRNNGSFLDFQIALWTDVVALSIRLSQLGLEWWRTNSRQSPP